MAVGSRSIGLCPLSGGLVVGLCLYLFCRGSLLGHGLSSVLVIGVADVDIFLLPFRNDSLMADDVYLPWSIVCRSHHTDPVGNNPPLSASSQVQCEVILRRRLRKRTFGSLRLFQNVPVQTGCLHCHCQARRSTEIQQIRDWIHVHTRRPLLSLSLAFELYYPPPLSATPPLFSLIGEMSLPDYEGKDYVESDPDEPDFPPPRNKSTHSTPRYAD